MRKRDCFRQTPVYVIVGFAMLLTIFCIIGMILPNKSYYYTGEMTFDNIEKDSEVVVYDSIELPPGVYDVILEYQTDTNMKNLCTVTDGTVYTGGLLTNGEHLFENLSATNFRVWLFEGTESLRVNLVYGGEGYAVTGSLTICETNALWTLLLVIIWSIAGIACCVAAFCKYDRIVGIGTEKKNIIFGLFVITFLASLPYLQGGAISGVDLVYHMERIEGVKDGILSGQFPLRLEPEWLFDHGYANSIFYCNALLYFPAFLRLLGFTVCSSYNLFCIALNIATVCIAYYCFSRIFKSSYIGLLCCALYTLSVFRIYKLVITAALGEGCALAFMPLVLYGLYRAFTEDVNSKSYKTVWIPIAAGYAGLMQTHVLSCEITAFLTIIICLIFIKKIFIRQTFRELAKGALGAVAMSFWYLVPFLDYYINEDMHIRHVSARTIQDRGIYLPVLLFNWWKLGNNATSGDAGMLESHAMGIGLILTLGFALFCVLWFSGRWRGEKGKILSLGKVACVLGGMLMLMSLNIFPWDRIQRINDVTAALVSSLQFPNRFLGWGTVLLVTVCGCLLWYFKGTGKKEWYYLSVVCILAGITTSFVYLTDYVCRDKAYIEIYNEEGMGGGNIGGAEYLVEGTDQGLLFYGVPSTGENIELTNYEKEYLHIWASCKNTGLTQGYVEFPILHYNGYRAYAVSTGQELETVKGDNNLVRVLIPEGFDDEIEVKFVSPLHWRISEGVTYAWWILALFAGVRHLVKRKKKKIPVEER